MGCVRCYEFANGTLHLHYLVTGVDINICWIQDRYGFSSHTN
jgi:hypothetical protein